MELKGAGQRPVLRHTNVRDLDPHVLADANDGTSVSTGTEFV